MREISIKAGVDDEYIVKSHKTKSGVTNYYRVSMRNYFCNCKGFQYRHNCVHIQSVIQLLRAKGIGIFHDTITNSYYTNWDYQNIKAEVKRENKSWQTVKKVMSN